MRTVTASELDVRPGQLISTRWIKRNCECDDGDRNVFHVVEDLLPDCNLNALVESLTPRSVCIGNPDRFFWEDAKGLHASMFYRDARGNPWIPVSAMSRRSDHRSDNRLRGTVTRHLEAIIAL